MKSTSLLTAALIAGLASSSVAMADHHNTGTEKKADAKKKKHDKKGEKHSCGGKDGCGAKEGAKEGAHEEGHTDAPATEEAKH